MEQQIPHFFKEHLFSIGNFSLSHRRWIAALGAIFAGLFTLGFYLQSGPKALAFAKAEQIFAKWAALPQDEHCFDEMTKALRQVPQLQEKYAAILVQKLIEGGKGAEALQIAYRPLALAKQEIPFHAAFGETTLCIERGAYQESLERSVALKERMGKECEVAHFVDHPAVGGALLYAHNLLRVACLQQALGNAFGEEAAWEEFSAFLRLEKGSPLSDLILNSFREKGVDLSHYILERKSTLKQLKK